MVWKVRKYPVSMTHKPQKGDTEELKLTRISGGECRQTSPKVVDYKQSPQATRGGERTCRLFSRGVIFTRARVALSLLSLRKNGGLLVVYQSRESVSIYCRSRPGREIDLDLTKRSNCLISRDYEKLRRGIQRYFTNIKTHVQSSVYSIGDTRRTAPHVTSHPIKATFLSHVGSVQAIGSSQNISSSKAKQGLQTLTF